MAHHCFGELNQTVWISHFTWTYLRKAKKISVWFVSVSRCHCSEKSSSRSCAALVSLVNSRSSDSLLQCLLVWMQGEGSTSHCPEETQTASTLKFVQPEHCGHILIFITYTSCTFYHRALSGKSSWTKVSNKHKTTKPRKLMVYKRRRRRRKKNRLQKGKWLKRLTVAGAERLNLAVIGPAFTAPFGLDANAPVSDLHTDAAQWAGRRTTHIKEELVITWSWEFQCEKAPGFPSTRSVEADGTRPKAAVLPEPEEQRHRSTLMRPGLALSATLLLQSK